MLFRYPVDVGALIWLIVALVLAAAELLVGELTLLMLGVAALVVSGVALFDIPLWAEVVIFGVSSLGTLVLLKPALRKRMHTTKVLDTSPNSLIGTKAQVLESTDFNGGQVRLDGSIWSARALSHTDNFAPGEVVQVVEIDGTTAVVWKGA